MKKYYPRIDNGIFQLNDRVAYRVANISYISKEGLIIYIYMTGVERLLTISSGDESTAQVVYNAIVAEMCETSNARKNGINQCNE